MFNTWKHLTMKSMLQQKCEGHMEENKEFSAYSLFMSLFTQLIKFKSFK